MTKHFHILLAGVALLSSLPLVSRAQPRSLVVMSYNVENLFFPDDDPDKRDDDFTAEGAYNWTLAKFRQKCYNLASVIVSCNGWSLPDVVGLCEVEGPAAAEQFTDYMFRHSVVRYEPICFPTPDVRGVATALLYNPNTVVVESAYPINVSRPSEISDSNLVTRDVLYVRVRPRFSETRFHFFVNHWPSKMNAKWKQEHVARRVRQVADNILAEDSTSRIVMLGDFNSYANEHSLSETLGARTLCDTCRYRNLSGDVTRKSYKYKGHWDTLDHIIVTPAVCQYGRPYFRVVNVPELKMLEEDARNSGDKPRRTFIGPRFNETPEAAIGFSDHLPVMAILPFY